MTVKTFTLATIIYRTLSSVFFPPHALIRNEQEGGEEGTSGGKIIAR